MAAVLKIWMGYFIAYMLIKFFVIFIIIVPDALSDILSGLAYIVPVMLIVQTIYYKVYGPDIEKKKRLDEIRKEL